MTEYYKGQGEKTFQHLSNANAVFHCREENKV